jgi:hypothetical protein
MRAREQIAHPDADVLIRLLGTVFAVHARVEVGDGLSIGGGAGAHDEAGAEVLEEVVCARGERCHWRAFLGGQTKDERRRTTDERLLEFLTKMLREGAPAPELA